MEKENQKNSIERKIFRLLILIILVSSFLCYLVFAFSYYYTYKNQVSSHLKDREQLTWENISTTLNQVNQLSIRLLSDTDIQEKIVAVNQIADFNNPKNLWKCNRYISAISSKLRSMALLENDITTIRIYTKNGISFTYESNFAGTIDPISADDIYAKNGGALWLTSEDLNYIYLARAILNLETMEPLGYMVILCPSTYLEKCLSALHTPYSGNVYLVDKGNVIIASADSSIIGQHFLASEKDTEQNSTVEDPLSLKKSYYYGEDVMDNGWRMITTVSSEYVWDNLRINLVLIGIAVFFTILLGIILSRNLTRKVFKPTKDLQNCMKEFGNGNLRARMQITEMNEIGQISTVYNQMAEKIQALLEQVYSLEIANKEAEIDYLKMQINPHFLYNTLDTISWLGFKNGNEDVSNLTVSLAKLLRFSLSREDFVTVKQEMNGVQEYLQIQSYRFRDRFEILTEINPDILQLYMPKFLIQPLVENSIIHGLEGLTRKGILQIQIWKEACFLFFKIEDNGTGIPQTDLTALLAQCKDMSQKDSIGLKNVYRRLFLLYGDSINFTIDSHPDSGTKISFQIPLTKERS